MANVVSVADVGELEAAEGAEFFFESKEIGERLAGMKFIGERVDHGNAGVSGHFLEDFLLVDASDDAVDPAIEIARDIGDGLARAERGEACVWSRKTTEPPMLWMPTSKVTRVRSEGFSKISAMNFPVQRGSVTARARFDVGGELKQIARVRGAPFRSGEQIIR